MSVYLDSSFLVSVYSVDGNFEAAMHTMETSSGSLLVTIFAEVEVVNAFELRVFRKQISRAEANSCRANFDRDLLAGVLHRRDLPETIFRRARRLSLETTAQLGIRTADILHVAAALELGAEEFYSFDKRQRELAQAVKLEVNDWPQV